MDDLRFFRYLIALTEHGHFARAARSVGVSQPALSLGIKRLELELGAKLFDRVRGQITPTPFGEAAIRRAREMVGRGEELMREISMLKGLASGSLVVVAGTFAAEMSGLRAMGRVLKRYPSLQCRIELREWNRCTEMLLRREADLALAEVGIAEAEPQLVSDVIGTHAGTFFCRSGHPLLKVRRPMLNELIAYPWALVPLPPRITQALRKLLPAPAGRYDKELNQFVPSVRVETVGGMKQIVAHSDAISGAPIALIQNEIRRGVLAPIRFSAPWLHLNYGFVYLRDRMLSPAARAFITEVRAIEGEFAREGSRQSAQTKARRRAGNQSGQPRV